MLIAVPGEVKNTGIILKDILDALTMVDIPVDNEDPLQTVFLLGVFGRYGHIVEHAEPVGSSPLAVVPRRSHQGKPIVRGSCQHSIHQLQRGPRGQPGTVEGTRVEVDSIVLPRQRP